MELKATLNKPYTEEEKVEFIIEQNHNLGYEIRGEEPETLEAWGYTQEEKEQQERERIDHLSLTKREVFLAIYKDNGIIPEQIRSMLTTEETKIEFDYANDYFRGNPLIEQLGQSLGYSSDKLDYLFINKSFSESE